MLAVGICSMVISTKRGRLLDFAEQEQVGQNARQENDVRYEEIRGERADAIKDVACHKWPISDPDRKVSRPIPICRRTLVYPTAVLSPSYLVDAPLRTGIRSFVRHRAQAQTARQRVPALCDPWAGVEYAGF
jgi:hypothetical protein